VTITPALLRAAVGCSQDLADTYAEHLSVACGHYGIDTPERLAALLAQIGHESGSFRHTRELWGPTPAQARYEGRADLGNTQPGDGERFKGRGLIQITGRDNYRRTAERMAQLGAPDFEATPEALESPKWAAWSACDWWAAHGCNRLADAGDFVGLTKRINGGLNGIGDRQFRWERAKQALAVAPAPTPLPEPEKPAIADPGPVAADPEPTTNTWRSRMAPFLLAALPAIIEAIPKLGKLFGSGSQVSERNLAAVELAVGAVKDSLGAKTEQEAVQILQTDPAAVATATKAVDAIWFQLTEVGGGGIDGARKADRAAAAAGDMLHSPSFWVTLALLPLVYMVVGSVVGLWGESWPSDVRAAIATAIVSLVVGGAAGYFWGTSTSRNRAPAP
jgi:putative chitinase